jgi:choloylglycine hydrolase
MHLRHAFRLFLAGILLLAFTAQLATACTGIRLTAQDGTVVRGRTLEFGFDLKSNIIMVPRGFERVGITPDGKPGMKWNAKYASLGANGVDLPYIFDGLNEKGLAVGTFYFPTSTEYMPYTPADAAKTIAPWQVNSYLLENFGTVDEVRQNIDKILVPSVVFEAWGFAPPIHYVVYDATGKSIVIEYSGGKLHVFDNPLGVITNSPAFDWHMTNLRNYVNFSMNNVPPVKLSSGVTLEPIGQGTGMLGLPGDFTPPSRFVRAVAFSQSVLPSATADDAVLELFHILNDFDIPKGAARDGQKDSHGNIEADYTLWTSVCDLKTMRFYFRTYENSQIRMVELTKMKLNGKDMVTIPMAGPEMIKNVTP